MPSFAPSAASSPAGVSTRRPFVEQQQRLQQDEPSGAGQLALKLVFVVLAAAVAYYFLVTK